MNRVEELLLQFGQERVQLYNHSPRTVEMYSWEVRNFLKKRALAGSPVVNPEDITESAVKEYLEYGRTVHHWKSWTYRGARKGLAVFFKWLKTNRWIEQNPMESIPAPKPEKTLPRAVAKADAFKILDAAGQLGRTPFARKRNRLLMAIMLFAGVRRKEAVQLTLSDLDLGEGMLTVRSGKGAKDRLIPISTTLKFYLQEYLKLRKPMAASDRLLLNVWQTGPLNCVTVTLLARKIRHRCKVAFSPHRLRHSFATMMIQGGADLYSLSRILGHSDIRTTTIYLSISAAALQKEILKHPMG